MAETIEISGVAAVMLGVKDFPRPSPFIPRNLASDYLCTTQRSRCCNAAP